MVLRSDDLLDQLDLRLSKMQAELPSNPDTRPLPSGWVEHLDLQRKVWYYIDLGASQPRATFVHPSDESPDEGEESANAPASAKSTQSCATSSSGSSSSNSTTTPPSRTAAKTRSITPIPSPICRRGTIAQQLYASSLGAGSISLLASPQSVSSSDTDPNSDPENPHVASTPLLRSFTQGYPSSSPRSTSPGPAFPIYPNSHDPRNFFDVTRLSQGARKYRHDEPSSRSNGSPQSGSAQTPSVSRSPPPRHPSSGGPSSRADRPTNNGSSANNALGLTNEPTSGSPGPISPEAHALYPSVVFKPPHPSRPAILADRQNYSISVPLSRRVSRNVSRNVSVERGQKRPQPIYIGHHSPDNYKLYTAVTEDESLKVAPNSSSTAHLLASGVTEDNLIVLPSHPTPSARDSHLSPTINVLDVQNPDSPPQGHIHESKPKLPLRAPSISRLHIRKKKKSPPVGDTLVLQQPRPMRPLGDVPAHLNVQVAALNSSEDAQYYAESFKGKGKERKSYGFSSIFETMDRLACRESGIILKEYT